MGVEQNMHRAKLTKVQATLMERVEAIHEMGSASYALTDDERDTAARLVDMGLLFYSMDYDHVACYRPAVL